MEPVAVEAREGRVQELRFAAMGTDAHVVVVGGPPDLAVWARDRIEELEARWSRFRPTSEVCRLNAAAGTAQRVSADTALLARRAADAWRLSGASVDALVLGAMEALGYDRTFDDVVAAGATSARGLPTAAWALAASAAEIEVDGNEVRVPAGAGLDPGGIGKGLAADLVVAEVLGRGAAGACVNLGGDLRVAGPSPRGGGWTIDVEHAGLASPLCRIGVAGGGVATSTTLRRRWQQGGIERHHLVDPATGEPSSTDLTSVTVVAGDAFTAEVLAKAVLLRGSEHRFAILGGTGAEAVAVDERGGVHASGGFATFLGGVELPARLPGDPAAIPRLAGGSAPRMAP